MEKEEKEKKVKIIGRRKITSYERKTVSKRAANGKITVNKDKKCPNCHHGKYFENMSMGSPNFGNQKCCKCGYQIK